MRVGIGYDVHRCDEARDLVLGGVELPHEVGLAGHSDADVLLHAIVDALLGAAALGDIGQHFSPDDPLWKDASSLDLLGRALALVREAGLDVGYVSASVIPPGREATYPTLQESPTHWATTSVARRLVESRASQERGKSLKRNRKPAVEAALSGGLEPTHAPGDTPSETESIRPKR